MTKHVEIILSGVGGQGLVLAGKILGNAAVRESGLNATMLTSYGIETRGTFSKSDVIISNQPIPYPEAETPDIILAIAQVAYDHYIDMQFPKSPLIIYDSTQIKPLEREDVQQMGVPLAEMARTAGHVAAANIVGLGIMVSKHDFISADSVISTISTFFSGRALETNLTAFNMGLDLGAK